MGDYLISLGQNAAARRMLSFLPIPLPQSLRRGEGALSARPLAGRVAVVGGAPGGALHESLAICLGRAGASVCPPETERDPYIEAAEAWGQPLVTLGESDRPDFLIFDGTGLSSPTDLIALRDFFQPHIRRLARCGRVVVLGHTGDWGPAQAATAAALEGFVRSVAKEVGRKGATANLIRLGAGTEDRLEPLLRFLLSSRSAFITGQPFALSADVTGEVPESGAAPLDGKVALVTGAARGIGAQIARRMAAEGARVVLLDREPDAIESLATELGGVALALDVTAEDAPHRIVNFLHEYAGGVDIVVHNAGVTRDRTLGKMTEAEWGLTVAVNLQAPMAITEALLSGTLREGGRIIMLSSIAGIAGNLGQTNYAASKAGLIGLVRHLAPRLASKGITVNAVAPGFVETAMTAAIPAGTREAGRRLSALAQGGLPIDIAELITFLSTPGAVGLTGQTLRACGGSFLGA
ncbi:MAG: 3-oxoacyl-[acyl-carrier protein] reductase [Myxococcota bacterium]|jgi:3-oxoacyl-[acyl-carrier protein] reductase